MILEELLKTSRLHSVDAGPQLVLSVCDALRLRQSLGNWFFENRSFRSVEEHFTFEVMRFENE